MIHSIYIKLSFTRLHIQPGLGRRDIDIHRAEQKLRRVEARCKWEQMLMKKLNQIAPTYESNDTMPQKLKLLGNCPNNMQYVLSFSFFFSWSKKERMFPNERKRETWRSLFLFFGIPFPQPSIAFYRRGKRNKTTKKATKRRPGNTMRWSKKVLICLVCDNIN